jgi:hypothetical protein
LLSVAIAATAVGCKSSQQLPDQFPVRKQTRYFDFRYERNSPQIEGMARFADGYINVINRDFFKADFDYPIRVFMLEALRPAQMGVSATGSVTIFCVAQ